jgi:NADPH-dependent curcumin reductase CurA
LAENGFRIDDHLERYEAGLARLEALVAAGTLKSFETISHGLAALPDAFLSMLAGKGFGKHLVQVAE